MFIFTLVIFWLTMSHLPWFIDLTFEVSMQYCSFQHQTLLSPPNTHSLASFPLWPSCFILTGDIINGNSPPHFPCSIFGHLQAWGAHLLTSYLFAFSYRPCGSQGKNTGVGPRFVRTLYYDPSILDGLAQSGSLLHWVMQAPSPQWSCDPWRENSMILVQKIDT